MIAAGVNAKALSAYMGHSSITITLDRYGHLMPGSEAEAAGMLEAYLERDAGDLTRLGKSGVVAAVTGPSSKSRHRPVPSSSPVACPSMYRGRSTATIRVSNSRRYGSRLFHMYRPRLPTPSASPCSRVRTDSTPRHHDGQRSESQIAWNTSSRGASRSQVVRNR